MFFIDFRNEDIVESDQPNSNISLSILEVQDQQERPDTSEISIIDDCGTVPWTELLNFRPIVDYKYAYFHHDDDDVQQSTTDFIDENNLKPNILCTGSACDAIDE